MTLNEGLIRRVLSRSNPEDLGDVMTTIEAYRTCVRTATRLQRSRTLNPQRQQVVECAEYCEGILAQYADTGRIARLRYPSDGSVAGHFTIEMRW